MSNHAHFFRDSEVVNFTLQFTTTSPNQSINFPLVSSGVYNGEIDWGDGTVVPTDYSNRSHTYVLAGTYTVVVTGQIEGFSFRNEALSRPFITNILSWGQLKITNGLNCFIFCVNLDISATDNLDLSLATSLSNFFYGCSNLVYNDSINNWDVSTITNSSGTFRFCDLFNQPLNNWDVSNIGNSSFMFSSAFSFNKPLDNWLFLNNGNYSQMFSSATAFNQDVSMFDYSNTVNITNYMANKTDLNYSASNYDLLLAKLNSEAPNGLSINMGTIKYTSGAVSDRDNLVNVKGWTIVDGGQV